MADRNDNLRTFTLLALGAAGALLLSRLRAPLALKAGAVRGRITGVDAFDELIADHRRVEAALDKAVVEQSAAKKLALFTAIKLDLTKHAVAEEDVIYPLIADKLMAVDGSQHLYKEHGAVKTLLAEIEEAIAAGDDTRYRARVGLLREEVRRHAQEEETQWFPRLREILRDDRRSLVTGKVSKEKALVG